MRVSHFVENPHIIKEKERDTMSFSIISIRQLASWQAREGTILIDLREREEIGRAHQGSGQYSVRTMGTGKRGVAAPVYVFDLLL